VGLIARCSSNLNLSAEAFVPDRPNGLTFNGRLNNWRSYTGPGNTGPLGARDQMSTWSIVNFGGVIYLGNPSAVSQVGFRWVPGRTYRLVFSNTNTLEQSPQFYTASIYDVNDLTRPLLSMTGDDSYNANYLYIPQYGYVGVFAFKLSNNDYDPTVDVTFDNFYVGEGPPATAVLPPAIPHGKWGVPQVINRVPASFQNFHPAASGIAFQATTLTTTNAINTNAIKLFLNGVDVSAGLVVSGFATNVTVTYSGLASNTVYDARIELQDALGRKTTNEWTFDTFSDAYLASPAVKVIEAEDYDFDGGQFINDPPASGYANYDPMSDSGTLINSGVGYVDRVGTPGGVDFFDRDNSIHTGEFQYRHSDAVGTQQGNFGHFVYADTALVVGYGLHHDTQRSKYSSLDPTLHEYIVERTEGGEWLNYTRVFNGSQYYNAYLRAAGGLAQPVRFDQIAAGPVTNTLGRFHVPSTFYLHNYRYVPLVGSDGAPAVVNLNGTTTVRLTMDSPQNEATKQGLALNYVALVPAAPQLYSAATVNGPYTPELKVLVDPGAKRIIVPQSGAARFYRIGWHTQVTIQSVQFWGGNVVLTYQ